MSNSVHPSQDTPHPFQKDTVKASEEERIKELEMFNSHNELFVKRSVDDRDKGNPNAPNCYDVLSTFGQPVFKVVQTMEQQQHISGDVRTTKAAFRLSVFDMKTGNEILKLMAKSGPESVIVYARQKYLQYYGIGKILRIRRGNIARGPDYNVRGSNGKIAMKVNGSYCFLYKRAYFNIQSADNIHCIGKIRKDSESCDTETNNGGYLESQNALYKISFSADMNITLKALTLATTLILDFDYFQCGLRETKCDCILLTTALAAFTLLIAIVVLILSVNITQKLNAMETKNGTRTSARNELDELVEWIDPNIVTTTEAIK